MSKGMLLVLLNNYYKSVVDSEQIYWDYICHKYGLELTKDSERNMTLSGTEEGKDKFSDAHRNDQFEKNQEHLQSQDTKSNISNDSNVQDQLLLQLQKQVHKLTRDINMLQRDNDELLHANKSIRALSESKQCEWKRKFKQLTQEKGSTRKGALTSEVKGTTKENVEDTKKHNSKEDQNKLKKKQRNNGRRSSDSTQIATAMLQSVFDTSSDSDSDVGSFVNSLRVTNTRTNLKSRGFFTTNTKLETDNVESLKDPNGNETDGRPLNIEPTNTIVGFKKRQERPKIKIAKRRIDKL